MPVSARMQCCSIKDNGYNKEVELSAAYPSDPASPNYSYSSATPSANFKLHIINPAANYFESRKIYDIQISEYVEQQKFVAF